MSLEVKCLFFRVSVCVAMLGIKVIRNLTPYSTATVKIVAEPRVQYLGLTFLFQKAKLRLLARFPLTFTPLTAVAE